MMLYIKTSSFFCVHKKKSFNIAKEVDTRNGKMQRRPAFHQKLYDIIKYTHFKGQKILNTRENIHFIK